MLDELLRPVLRFLFWNRWRPAAAAAVLIVLIAIIARAASGGAHGHSPAGGHPRPVAAATARASSPPPTPAAPSATPPAAALPSATPQPTVTGLPPAAALTAARQFMAAWVSRGPGWAARLRPYATALLAAQLSGISPAGNPATAVTGSARVTSQAPGTVSLTVPTTAGPALLTVRQAGGRWLAAAVMLARTGN